MFRTIEDIQHEMKQREQVTQKTIGELEKQIKSLQNQVRHLLNQVGKLPLNTGNELNKLIKTYKTRIRLQNLESDGCTNLNEWLAVHDTEELFPGHCVQFTSQGEHFLTYTQYVFGWEDLFHKYHRTCGLRFNTRASEKQWASGECPTDWAVLSQSHLCTDKVVLSKNFKGGSNG